MTLEHFVNKIIQFYEELLGPVDNLPEGARLRQRLRQLNSIKEKELNPNQLLTLLRCSLHALVLSIASGYTSSQAIGKKLEWEDINNIGVSSDIKGRLKCGGQPHIADTFIFETMVRAWYGQYFGTTFPDLKRKNGKRGEFIIERENFSELVECKKIVSCSEEETLRKNFRDRLENAEKQFQVTKEVLNIKNSIRHLLVDVSEHSDSKREFKSQSRSIIERGNTAEELDNIKKIIGEEIKHSKIEQLTIISDKVYLIDGQPRGIIQFPEIVRGNKSISNYGGWSVTALAGKLFEERIKELMIYSESLPEKDIIGKQDAFDGQFFYQQAAESTGKS
jgi:hypothetical protein